MLKIPSLAKTFGFLLIVLLAMQVDTPAQEIPLHGKAVARFADLSEAKTVLTAQDRFIQSLSPFDRQSRLETDQPVSEEQFLKYVAEQVLPWKPEQIAHVEQALNRLGKKLAPLSLPLPERVLLIQTTGREEGQAAYCRANAIVLPAVKIADSVENLERLLTHELFHILSSHNAELRGDLYRTIGFEVCAPIEIPSELASKKITNPDAPQIDAWIQVEWQDAPIHVAPILYSRSDIFDTKQGGPFFRYLVFRLMKVEEVNGKWRAARGDDGLQLLAPNDVPDFAARIGRNTNYIIHPDEILADNFVHLVQGTSDLPSPEIVDAMRKRFRKPE